MNAQQLKNAILQEAIEGRLVPQDPNDEPASALLARIRKEKERLVKEGKLKKKDLEVNPISEDEIPFDIPESWEWVRFGTITINRDSERIPLSVDERSRLEKKYDYYGASGVIDKVDRYLFNKPLLLIGEDGANLINRSTPIAFIAKGEYWVNNHAHVLDYLNEDLMQYMCWYINAISLVDYVTGTAQPKMNQEKMNSIPVALPPLAEQKRIVAKIEELLPKVEKYGKAQDELNKLNEELPERLKKSILQEAIEGRLVPQDPNDEPASILLERIRAEKERLVKEGKIALGKPEKACKIKDSVDFSLPSNWCWAMINDVCRVFGRIGFRGYTKEDLRDTKEHAAISISPSNMINGTLDFSACTYISKEKYEESPEIKILDGDILIVKTGSSYGKASLVTNLPWISTINPQIAVIKDIIIDKKYLLYFLHSSYAQSKFNEFVLGTSIPTFSQLNLISMQIPLPPLAEQKRIVAKIEELLQKIDGLKK